LALAIVKEKKHMPLMGTLGAAAFGDENITKFIKEYKSLSSVTGTRPAA
jgi:hypothetical protein